MFSAFFAFGALLAFDKYASPQIRLGNERDEPEKRDEHNERIERDEREKRLTSLLPAVSLSERL